MSIELNRNASTVDQLKAIATMAYGSREGDAGGAGRIGMLNGRVVKFNTHLGERLFGAKADQRMFDSCNTLRLEPLLDDKGHAVVREVTAEDLAPLGPAIMAVILGEI